MNKSYVSVRARLSKAFLQKTIEKELQSLIGKNGIKLNVNQGELHIEAIENIKYIVSSRDIQLSADIEVDYHKEAGIDVAGHGIIRLIFNIAYEISPEFKLSTKIRLSNHEWLEKPSIKVGKLSIPSKGALDLLINTFEDTLGKKIDGIIAEKLDLQKLVTHQLARLENPIPNPVDKNIHLFIDPDNLLFNITEQEVDYSLAVHTTFDAKIEWEPQENMSIFSALPKIEEYHGETSMSQLNVPVKVNFDALSNMLMKQFAEVTVLGRNLQVKDIKLRFDERLKIKAVIEGDVSGVLDANAIPRLDIAAQKLHLDDLQYDITTSNFLVKAATFLAKSEINKRLDQFSTIPLQPIIAPLLTDLNAKLRDFKIVGLDFSFVLDSLELHQLRFLPDHLITHVEIKANQSVV
jgi:hypothetical protein